jgi:CheY-like chemotaxis protein
VVLADWFTLEGHDVSTADSAERALELLQTQTQATPFDAGIFDVGLPGMSGHDLARRVRADARWQGMVLLALTGYGQESDRDKARAAGFDAHFSKPPDLERIQDALYRR